MTDDVPSKHEILEFLQNADTWRYRRLIRHHVRRSTEGWLAAAILAEIGDLPDELASAADRFLESVDETFGYDRGFWRNATGREAFDRIITIAIAECASQRMVTSPSEALQFQHCELAFRLFQMATLHFAYAALTEESRRRVMGIRQSVFT